MLRRGRLDGPHALLLHCMAALPCPQHTAAVQQDWRARLGGDPVLAHT